MKPYVLDLSKVDKDSISLVGGKWANLGELIQAGFNVPNGFCITTETFKYLVSQTKKYYTLIDKLDMSNFDDLDNLKKISEKIHKHISTIKLPKELEDLIMEEITKIWIDKSFSIRSSFISEDLPNESFAGQQETFLNVKWKKQIIKNIQKCFASLFTDRAIFYRKKNNYSNKSVFIWVIVQEMIFSEASGVLFTADPISWNRNITSINASFWLWDPLVWWYLNSDLYLVSDWNIIKKDISQKNIQIISDIKGGIIQEELSTEKQYLQTLSDKQLFKLYQLWNKIEKYFDTEQEIEWCLYDDEFYIVQSSPIADLFPLPEKISKWWLNFYMSIWHNQMMTEAFKPLWMSVFLSFSKFIENYFKINSPLLNNAGNHLYIDLMNLLEYKIFKKSLPFILENVDKTSSRILVDFMKNDEFKSIKSKSISFERKLIFLKFSLWELKTFLFLRFKNIYWKLDKNISNRLQKIDADLNKANSNNKIAKIKTILNTIPVHISDTRLLNLVPAAILSFKLLQLLSKKWLWDTDEIDDISKAPDWNVTTEMWLVIGDLADKINANLDVRYYFENSLSENFEQELKKINGGQEFLNSFNNFIEKYWNRCIWEIDLSRPRWKEEPYKVVLMILNNVKNQELNKHRNDFLLLKKEADKASEKLIKRVKKTKYWYFKALVFYRLIYVYRSLIWVIEHPKFFVVNLLGIIRSSLLQEAELLVKEKVIKNKKDIFYFTFDELNKIFKTREVDKNLLKQRKQEYIRNAKLKAPLVFTWEWEILVSKSKFKITDKIIYWNAASSWIVEGRARVIYSLDNTILEHWDIIVTTHTDSSWTTLLATSAAFVTEEWWLINHWAVIARDFGIPAVVWLDEATLKINDGDFIRVNWTEWFVEILNNYK